MNTSNYAFRSTASDVIGIPRLKNLSQTKSRSIKGAMWSKYIFSFFLKKFKGTAILFIKETCT